MENLLNSIIIHKRHEANNYELFRAMQCICSIANTQFYSFDPKEEKKMINK